MKKWIIRVAIVLAVGGIIFGIPFLLSDTYDVKREITINRPLEEVFTYVSNLENWQDWDPTKDSQTRYDLAQPSGKGAKVSWAGQESGQGTLVIDSVADGTYWGYTKTTQLPSRTEAKQFIKFKFEGVTVVTWHETGTLSYPFGKWKGLFLDGKIGVYFEKGLLKLKENLEAKPKAPDTHIEYQFVQTRKMYLYTVRDSTTDMNEIAAKLGAGYGEIGKFLTENKIPVIAPPMTITIKYDMENTKYVFDVAMPVDSFTVEPQKNGRIQKTVLPSTDALLVAHWGPYDQVSLLYKKAYEMLAEKGYKPIGHSWEQYINDPTQVKPSEIETHVYIPFEMPKAQAKTITNTP